MGVCHSDPVVVPLTLLNLLWAQADFRGTRCRHPELTGGQDGKARWGAVAGRGDRIEPPIGFHLVQRLAMERGQPEHRHATDHRIGTGLALAPFLKRRAFQASRAFLASRAFQASLAFQLGRGQPRPATGQRAGIRQRSGVFSQGSPARTYACSFVPQNLL